MVEGDGAEYRIAYNCVFRQSGTCRLGVRQQCSKALEAARHQRQSSIKVVSLGDSYSTVMQSGRDLCSQVVMQLYQYTVR